MLTFTFGTSLYRPAGQGAAYAKFVHPASRYAVVGVAAALTVSKGTCSAARVAVGGLVPRPTKASSVERAVVGKRISPDMIADAAGKISHDLGDDILDDIYASADYRRAMVAVYVKRALSAAAERAK